MMKNKHYRIWDINPQDFYQNKTEEDKVKFILQFGLLAPSSHNTQPWKFAIEQNIIHMYSDAKRTLTYSDPTHRLLFMTLGAVTENISIAADYYGLEAIQEVRKDMQEKNPLYVHSLRLEKSDISIHPKEFLEAVIARRSYRKAYQGDTVSQEVLNSLNNIKEQGVYFSLFTEQKDKDDLAEIAGIGMKEKMSIKNFRIELAHWLRNNLSQKPDGMPGFGHGLSLFISIIAPYIVKNIDVSSKEREKIIKRVRRFPAICVISNNKDSAREWLTAGRALERALITLTAQGIGVSIIAAPIESSTARAKLRVMINNNSLPQIVFGFGVPASSVPHSPRRKIEDVMI